MQIILVQIYHQVLIKIWAKKSGFFATVKGLATNPIGVISKMFTDFLLPIIDFFQYVANLVQTVKELKEQGVWIFGTDMKGTDFRKWSAKGATALVIGNEGKGMSEKVKKNCDFLVKIPMMGKVTSLNASVSTGIIIYEALKQRI